MALTSRAVGLCTGKSCADNGRSAADREFFLRAAPPGVKFPPLVALRNNRERLSSCEEVVGTRHYVRSIYGEAFSEAFASQPEAGVAYTIAGAGECVRVWLPILPTLTRRHWIYQRYAVKHRSLTIKQLGYSSHTDPQTKELFCRFTGCLFLFHAKQMMHVSKIKTRIFLIPACIGAH